LDVQNPKRLLPLVMTITGMGVLAFSAILPALPDLADELGVSRGAIGWVQGIVAIPGVFLAAIIGYLADRYGRREVIRASLVIFGVFGMALFFARDFRLLLLLRLLQGFGTSGLLSLGVVVIGDLFTGTERRWAMGLNLAALTGVTTLAPIAGGLLAEGGAFRPFLLYALALPVWVWARKLPDRPEAPPPAPPFRHIRAALSDLRGRGTLSDFLGVLPMSFVTLGIFLGVGLTVTPLFLESHFGLSAGQRGLVQAIGSAASSTASIMSGRVGQRFSRSATLSTSFLLMVAGFVIVGTAPSLWFVALGLAVLGSGTGSIFPLLQDYAASAGPAIYRGALVGTWVSANRLGQWLGPANGTLLADAVGERQSYGIAAATMVVVFIVWRPLRWTAKRRVRQG
jgi:MFS family permease